MNYDYHAAQQKGNTFEDNVLIEQGAILGKNNYFSKNCTVRSGCIIGDNNYFMTNVTLGSFSRERFQGVKRPKDITQTPLIEIGNNNIFEDHVVVQTSLEKVTKIGNHVCIGAFTHVSHDVVIEDYVITSSHCSIGGYSIIMEYANLGMGTRVHQRSVIGTTVMTGAGSVIIDHIAPYSTVVGVPAHYVHANKTGLKRFGISDNDIEAISIALDSGSLSELPEQQKSVFRTFKYAMAIWQLNKKCIPSININELN